MTIEKIPMLFPDEINYGIWQFKWPYATGVANAFGVVALLCDGSFLYAPFDSQEQAEAYVVDDSYCHPISCEGAKDYIIIETTSGYWSVSMDGLGITGEGGYPELIADTINTYPQTIGRVTAEWDGTSMRINNIDPTSTHTFRFNPQYEPSMTFSDDPDSTPYHVDENGVVTFCLSAYHPVNA